ncbi:MAG TPA: hypothetical protein DEB31_00910 [Clostridiales bacterium]|nr:hypothetical protein [Clostridiales bacterium]
MSNCDVEKIVPGEDMNVGELALGKDINIGKLVLGKDIVLKGNIVVKGECVCHCGNGGGNGDDGGDDGGNDGGNGNGGGDDGGNGGGGDGGTGTVVENCPHPSWPFTGTAMADFAKTERCVAVETAATGEMTDITDTAVDSGAGMRTSNTAYSPDGQWFVATGDGRPFVQMYKKQGAVWALQESLPNTGQNSGYCNAAAFSSDSQCLALGFSVFGLRLYELSNGVWIEKTTLIEGTTSANSINDVQFSADGRWLACAIRGTTEPNFILFNKGRRGLGRAYAVSNTNRKFGQGVLYNRQQIPVRGLWYE